MRQAYLDNPETNLTLWSSGEWDPFNFEGGNGLGGDFQRTENGDGFSTISIIVQNLNLK